MNLRVVNNKETMSEFPILKSTISKELPNNNPPNLSTNNQFPINFQDSNKILNKIHMSFLKLKFNEIITLVSELFPDVYNFIH